MKNENISEMITNNWFDEYQIGLTSRFSANGMDYNYRYEKKESNKSVIVQLKKNGLYSIIQLNSNGTLSFEYSKDNKSHLQKFKECTTEDFHTMIAHAFIYLRDQKFDYHKKWFEKLIKY